MEAIYGPRGNVVAWLNSSHLLDLRGRVIGWLDRREVYAIRGSHVGRYENGFFRDRQGHAVAWSGRATGGPITPVPAVPPVPPVPAVPPVPPIFAIPAVPAIPSFSWSDRSFDQFVQGT